MHIKCLGQVLRPGLGPLRRGRFGRAISGASYPGISRAAANSGVSVIGKMPNTHKQRSATVQFLTLLFPPIANDADDAPRTQKSTF